ncbi:hypothetical protein [Sanguibacter sp. Z1732]|uniref:hypothetical protein n=1 Tax=Sanguibacter sp. Z1732 TaxID=3435412 RepID=UPI003D9C8F0F
MRLIEFLRKPSAFIAANWAGLLGVLTVGGAVPAFAATSESPRRWIPMPMRAGSRYCGN